MKIRNMSDELLKNKIGVALTLIGLRESHISFEYLTYILIQMLRQNSDSISIYRKAILDLSQKFNIAKISVNYGLKTITNECLDESIKSKTQYNLSKHGTLNRVRVLKSYIIDYYNLEE